MVLSVFGRRFEVLTSCEVFERLSVLEYLVGRILFFSWRRNTTRVSSICTEGTVTDGGVDLNGWSIVVYYGPRPGPLGLYLGFIMLKRELKTKPINECRYCCTKKGCLGGAEKKLNNSTSNASKVRSHWSGVKIESCVFYLRLLDRGVRGPHPVFESGNEGHRKVRRASTRSLGIGLRALLVRGT